MTTRCIVPTLAALLMSAAPAHAEPVTLKAVLATALSSATGLGTGAATAIVAIGLGAATVGASRILSAFGARP